MMVQKTAYIEALSATASQAALYNFIRLVDLSATTEEEDFTKQILARATLVLGNQLLDIVSVKSPILKTLEAAELYLLEPTEFTWQELFQAATNSYPFGPGEGCYSIKALESGKSCAPGSGCRSSAGFFASLGLDDALSFSILQKALLPWLLEVDPPKP